MSVKVPENDLVLEDVQITYRNFAGAPTKFNVNGGVRSFSVWIDDPETAAALADMGWLVKYSKLREGEEVPRAHMPVTVKYHPRLRPPRIKMITSRGQTSLDEEAIDILDFMDIDHCDMILRPFKWEFNGNEGVKNMLASIYVTVKEDALEEKYADLPELGGGSQQKAIGGGQYSTPFDGEIVDEAALIENQFALEQGRGF